MTTVKVFSTNSCAGETIPVSAFSGSVRWAMALTMALLPLTVSCQPSTDSTLSRSGEISSNPSELSEVALPQPQNNEENALAQKIVFRQFDGSPEFSLQFKSTGGKLLDPAGKVIANLILENDGAIRLTDTANATVGYVVREGGTLRVEGPKRAKTLFTFEQQANGDAVLTRHNGSVLYQLSATDGGYIVKSDKAPLFTAVASKGRGQLQTSEGQTMMSTDTAIVPAAIASFGFDKLTQAQQAGLAYALSAEGR